MAGSMRHRRWWWLVASLGAVSVIGISVWPEEPGQDAIPLFSPSKTAGNAGLDVDLNRLKALAALPDVRFTATIPGLGSIVIGPARFRGEVFSARVGKGEINLAAVDGGVYGALRVNGRVFELTAREGRGYAFTEVPEPNEPDILRPLAVSAVSLIARTACPKDNQLTVTVGYTPEVLKHQPSVATKIIPGAEKLLNDSLVDAGTTLRFTFVPVATNDSDFKKLASPNDGHWDDLARSADDLVVLLVKEATASGLSTLGSTPTQRFAVVKVDQIPNLSLSHEIGHLAGGDHELQSTTTTPVADAHGFFVDREFRTIMADGQACAEGCDRVNVYSNPLLEVYGFQAGDAASANVARVLSAALPAINEYSCQLITTTTHSSNIASRHSSGLSGGSSGLPPTAENRWMRGVRLPFARM
jgi:hypothetical protein